MLHSGADAGLRLALRLDLLVLRGPHVLGTCCALLLALGGDLLLGKVACTPIAGAVLGLGTQAGQCAVDRNRGLDRLYACLPLSRREHVAARWIEGLGIVALALVPTVLAAALTGEWDSLARYGTCLVVSIGVGVPVFLCLPADPALLAWAMGTGVLIAGLYGILLVVPVTGHVLASGALVTCLVVLVGSWAVAWSWYARQDH
ncbi:hypothetical protein [Actinomyces howellii]|uniref:ABC-2 family transporter protein n=1 Tax=Actinomyces howellii TaxID=52771 RepID=A0A448HID4_9ACTO|nr:hypothetical protein [Actinomyces howellii]VEG29214.1 Uncharacterised protein [Actinomyces howellii]